MTNPTPEMIEAAAKSIATMVTEYVEGGIKGKTDWRNGLESIIAKRLSRFASPAPLPVAVKALEWHQHDTWRVAGSVVGRYTVRPCLATNFAGQWLLSRDSVTIRLYPSEEQAISGGQADYETRIRSALSQQEERRG